MRILVTNDDGILAPGLQTLASVAAKAGHEVFISAPHQQRSAASHCITISRPLVATEMQFPGICRAWAIEGTPADCVNLAINHLCPKIDVVLSGINKGFNAGTDTIYSGTVAAAMEGALYGKRALAVSLVDDREDLYATAAELALKIMDRTSDLELPDFSVININYPGTNRILGVRATPLRMSTYNNYYTEVLLPDGRTGYKLRGDMELIRVPEEDDCSWLSRGYATVTILTPDMTDRTSTTRLKAMMDDWD